jgi:DnaD/phage-associated family protein
MTDFPGFTSAETFTSVPDALFRLLGEIDDLDELRATLYVLWRLEHLEQPARYIAQPEIAADNGFMRALTVDGLNSGLEKAVRRGTLLQVESDAGRLYLLNSPTGRATAEALRKNPPGASARSASTAPRETSNIFKLYEENIGALTPLIADALKDAEKTYSAALIAEAFVEAVKMNKRNWKYIEAILRRWKEEGRAEKQDRRDTQEDRGRDVTRKVEDFLKRTR